VSGNHDQHVTSRKSASVRMRGSCSFLYAGAKSAGVTDNTGNLETAQISYHRAVSPVYHYEQIMVGSLDGVSFTQERKV
jgi:hypothetical protein